MSSGLTVRDLIREAEGNLRAAGCDSPRLDAELLLCHASALSRADLQTQSHVQPETETIAEFTRLIARRTNREPVAFITGSKWFRNLYLVVDQRVLMPRPETEFVVEVALSLPQGA